MSKKAAVFVGLGLMFAGLIALIVILLPKSAPRNDFRFAGETLRVGDKFATLLIVDRPRGFFTNLQKRFNYGVDLVLHDAADPGRVEVVTITERGEDLKLRAQAKLIGSDGRHLWLFGNTLVGLDLATRKRIGFAELSKANPTFANQWVEESKFYSVGGALPKLRLKLADARQFELDPGTLIGGSYQQEEPWAKPKDYAESRRQWDEYDDKSAMFGVGPEVYFWKGDRISNEEWFGLMSKDEATKGPSFASLKGRVSQGESAKGLWRAHLVVSERGTLVEKLERVGTGEYLDAGLLRTKDEARPLRLEGPTGYLVMHRSRLGEAGTLLLTRVDGMGKKIWELGTGITKLDQVLPSGRFLGLVGTSPLGIYSVDLELGTFKQSKFL